VGTAGHQYVGVRNVTDAERSPKAVLTVREAFAHSSNVGMSKLAYKAFANQPDLYKSYLHKFHLHQKTGIGLVGEATPKLPKIKRNKEGLHAMLTASFGYAIEVSPLHTAMLYNAVANNGRLMKPYLVSTIKSNGVPVQEFEPVVLEENFVKKEAISAARSAMEAVVTEGTAKHVFKDSPFPVAGKTGTAHFSGGNIKYHHGVYLASFAGYFPADKPQYTCVVLVKTKPHAAMHYGGQIAAPVFKEVANKLYAMYVQRNQATPNIFTPDSTASNYAGYAKDVKNVLNVLDVKYKDANNSLPWARLFTNNGNSVMQQIPVGKKLMPDVQGMNIKDAVYLLENLDVKVTVSGRGKVVMQSIAAGTSLNKNVNVTLLLN
jgi:cell division protein FtsI (penicillin-binding protein 3)